MGRGSTFHDDETSAKTLDKRGQSMQRQSRVEKEGEEPTQVWLSRCERCGERLCTQLCPSKCGLQICLGLFKKKKKKNRSLGFPGGPVGKNPPANAGDTASIPGPGKFHMPLGN